jgi:long-subunit acyl-CoA synthetase (AMP-forming)
LNFKNKLYNRLAEKPHPLFVFHDTVIPAATIWVGVRAWTKYFRELGLNAGDRILLAYPESPAFVHIVFAAIWEKLTLVILRPDTLDNALIEKLDVRLVITSKDFPYSVSPDTMGMPPDKIELRHSSQEKYPDVRFILQSSGSTGNPKLVCLSEKGILSVIHTHSKVFESKTAVVLSILPWSHCFGLVLDLFLSTFNADSIVRDAESGRNLDSLFSNSKKYNITYLSSVPLILERILQRANGKSFLHSLESGIVGGAPISNLLAEHLKNTNLRVGYGQTEATPGICLGEKGVFFPNYIGNPLGCEVAISEIGELLFRGENAFYGYWKVSALEKFKENNWIRTGDIVEERKEGLFFSGRLDFSFKLPSGVMIQPEQIEEDLKKKVKLISNCILFYNNGLYLLFSSYDDKQESDIVNLIPENIHPLLKNTSLTIKFLLSSEWILSPKGGVDRKAMLEKGKSFYRE